jgi:hypothetical protein
LMAAHGASPMTPYRLMALPCSTDIVGSFLSAKITSRDFVIGAAQIARTMLLHPNVIYIMFCGEFPSSLHPEKDPADDPARFPATRRKPGQAPEGVRGPGGARHRGAGAAFGGRPSDPFGGGPR